MELTEMNQDATYVSTQEKTKDERMDRSLSPYEKGPESEQNQMDQTVLPHTNGQDSSRGKTTHSDEAISHDNET